MSVTISPSSTRRLSADESLELWLEYRRTQSASLRDRLVLTFAPMVKFRMLTPGAVGSTPQADTPESPECRHRL